MANSVFKYGDDITWSLPVAFQYEIVWGAIFNHFRDNLVDLPRINGFGCPNCAWAGGRVSHVRSHLDKDLLKRLFEYFDKIKITPSFTFSCTSLEEEAFKDEYANYLLDMSFDYGAHYIIYDDRLKDYIRKKNPNAYCVASVVKPSMRFQGDTKIEKPTVIRETKLYNQLLQEYDLVVVRPEYSRTALLENPELIDDISRIEVLINQPCIKECPRMPEHYRHLESFRLGEEHVKNRQFQCIRATLRPEEAYRNTLCHSEEVVQKLVEHGVRHLKLQGRANGASDLTLLVQLYSQMFRSDGVNFLHFSAVSQGRVEMEKMYFDREVLRIQPQGQQIIQQHPQVQINQNPRPTMQRPFVNNVYRKSR